MELSGGPSSYYAAGQYISTVHTQADEYIHYIVVVSRLYGPWWYSAYSPARRAQGALPQKATTSFVAAFNVRGSMIPCEHHLTQRVRHRCCLTLSMCMPEHSASARTHAEAASGVEVGR